MSSEKPAIKTFDVAALGPLEAPAARTRQELIRQRAIARLWAHDPALWKTDAEHVAEILQRLGWLDLPNTMIAAVRDLQSFAQDSRAAGIGNVVLCGMGGSSLCPLVFARTFGSSPGYPRLLVLDSTIPMMIHHVDQRATPAQTLYLISSKSGGTIEVVSLYAHFWATAQATVSAKAGDHFAAITDPGTSLEHLAREHHFRRVFLNPPEVGGRYSALSFFGLVPGALIGLDLQRLLGRAQEMAIACRVEDDLNPGLWLGALLGAAARSGRDKLTFVVSPMVQSFALWLEQLLAESTGKEGRGVLPIAGEPVGPPTVYGQDRLFVYLRLDGDENAESDQLVTALIEAGQPVVRFDLTDRLALGAEFFRWEVATAIAGAVLAIDPFDQPNVQESKDNTARLLDMYQTTGRLPEPPIDFMCDGIQIAGASGPTLATVLADFLEQSKPGNYVAILAYLAETPAIERALQAFRQAIRDRWRVATTVGFGPRYLHSTGQYHKGGPPTGLFIQLTADVDQDIPIPGQPYTFGVLAQAQALGDLEALRRRGRPAIRVHLGAQPLEGIRMLTDAIQTAR